MDFHTGNNTVQGLTVEVNNPGDVAQPLGCLVSDGFPDVAFVQLCITDECIEARVIPRTKVVINVTASQRRKKRGSCTQAHGPCGEINMVRVLGARGVGLQSTQFAKACEVRTIQLAQEVLDGVEHGRSVRLDGDAVSSIKVSKVQRGKCGYERGGGGLVPSDLDPITSVAIVVG